MGPAMAPISPTTADLENHWWKLRVIVLVSLFLQTFLLFSGPLRKRTSRGCIITPIWVSYLLSTTLSIYGLTINKTTAETIMKSATTEKISFTDPHPYFIILWSSFLFLHLAPPDTITAFSLEDNQLWIRKMFKFCLYVFVIFTVTDLQDLGYTYTQVAAGLMIVVGGLENTSYILTLSDSFRVPLGIPRYFRPTITLEDMSADLIDLEVLKVALRLYYEFSDVIVGFGFTYQSCSSCRNTFLKLTAKDAFRVVERELNFFYDALYTKAWWANPPGLGVMRLVMYGFLWLALVNFCLEKNEKFNSIDVKITYLLLAVSIFRYTITFLIVLCSDWNIAYFCGSRLKDVALRLTSVTTSSPWLQKMVNRKWSNSLSQYNLISYSLGPSEGIFDPYQDLRKVIEGFLYVKTVEFSEEMRDLIIDQLSAKSFLADNELKARELQFVRGEWVLSQDESYCHLLPWICDFEFDECLLMWHIATELCFHTDNSAPDGHEDDDSEITPGVVNDDQSLDKGNKKKIVRDLSKCLSDYMIYLLIWQPAVMSPVAAQWEVKFGFTTDEIRNFLREKNIKRAKEEKLKACEIILSSYEVVRPANREANLLVHALDLTGKLKDLAGIRKWEVLSNVWVEMRQVVAHPVHTYHILKKVGKSSLLFGCL